jgi:hypothetical protein
MLRNTLLWIGSACTVALCSYSATASVEVPKNQVDMVYQFLNDHVVYKKMVLQNNPCQNGIAGTDIQCDFERTTIVSNLVRSEEGLKYNVIYSVKQTNRVPQSDGTFKVENKDRTHVTACEVRALKAEGAPKSLTGVCYGLANSLVDILGSAASIQLEISDGQLIQTSSSIGYADCYANNASGYRLCSSDTRMVTEKVGGKLQRKTTSVNYNISNPETGERVQIGGSDEYLDIEM